MSDDRPVDEPVDQIAQLRRELDDLRSTVMVRASRRPTGDIEPTIRTLAKGDTLLLQGQAVNRLDHPALWQWVQDQSLVMAGLFTVGNGSTTFGLPDFRGRVPIGAGVLGADSYALGALIGASTRTLTTANMPSHDHNVAVTLSQHEGHSHAITAAGGNHGSHLTGDAHMAAAGPDLGLHSWQGTGNSAHTHTMSVEGGGKPHSVTVNETAIGSGTGVDIRQPSIAVNWLVWT